MNREHLARLVVAALLVAGAWWVSENTEWYEEDVHLGASGEALTNPAYAFEQLLRGLGMQVVHQTSLDTLPPAQARLVLLSRQWSFIPGREERLKDWVLQGGHLVLTEDATTEALRRWLPAGVGPLERPAAGQSPRPVAPAASRPAPNPDIRTELISTPPLWGDTERLVTCHDTLLTQRVRARKGQTPSWTLSRHETTSAMRLPVGRGSVTLLAAGREVFLRAEPLKCDLPLLAAATVQAEAGALAWVYLEETREALLPWLWRQGWIAVLLGVLTLAAWLWRRAVRFGPLQASPPQLRRSIVEQVRGLGVWLQRGGTEALLAAQQRALDDTARRALPRHAQLPVAQRAAAIAEATGLPAHELAVAMLARYSTRTELAHRLLLLETARRRLS